MVYIAPPKDKGGPKKKPGPPKNGKHNRKELDVLTSKQEMLAQLTRQAEENTRILERERQALGLQGPPPPLSPMENRRDQRHHAPQHQAQPGNQRNRRNAPNGKLGPNRNHIFADEVNKKVFNPSQVPGLGGGGDGDVFAPHGGGGSAGAQSEFNQTFPDSPNFYPGLVFAVPGTLPRQDSQQTGLAMEATVANAPYSGDMVPQPGYMQQQQQPPYGASPFIGGGGGYGYNSDSGGAPPPLPPRPPGYPGAPPMAGGGQGPPQPPHGGLMANGSYGGPPQGYAGGSYGPGAPSPGAAGMQYGAGALVGAQSDDPRVIARLEAEAKKEAYRRELEAQIEAKKRAKDQEARRLREEDARWEAAMAAAPQPWDPEARAGRRGGGGDPHRDEAGRPVGDLRAAAAMGPHGGGGMTPQGAIPGPPGFPNRLTIDIPDGGSGAYSGPPPGAMLSGMRPSPGGPHHGGTLLPPPGPGMGMGPPPGPGGPALSPGGGPMALSPTTVPPVSPGNRRFMAAMNDLIAGPSDDQRRQKDLARQRLQADLEAQIREKKERQAREKAEMERERQKEEEKLRMFYEQQRLDDRIPGMMGAPPPPQPAATQQPSGPSPFEPLPPAARRRGKGPVIDASWLDNLPQQQQQQQQQPPQQAPQQQQPGVLSPGAQGRGGGFPDNGQYKGGMAHSPGQRPYGGGVGDPGGLVAGVGGGAPLGAGVVGGTVTGMLRQLQEEQSHLREEVSRQAAAMEQLAENAGRALEARDEAWQELQRVKLMLAGGAAGSPGPSPGAAAAAAAAIMGSPTPAVAAATKFLADAARAGSPGGGRLGAGGMGDPLEASSGMVIVETHLVPKTVNAIPDALPKPVASEVLRKGATDPGPHGSYGGGDEDGAGMYGGGGLGGYGGGGVRGLARAREFSSDGVRGDNPFGQMYGYEEHRNTSAARPGRSGIPMPPGGRPLRPPPGVYGKPHAHDGPPHGTKYNSFFPEGGAPSKGGHVPPQSPAILRGDHLPSPTRQTRDKPGANTRGGRTAARQVAGAVERPPRGGGGGGNAKLPAVAGARGGPPRGLAVVRRGSEPGIGLPPMAPGNGQLASRRSAESIQRVRPGQEAEKLIQMAIDMGAGHMADSFDDIPHLPPLVAGALAAAEAQVLMQHDRAGLLSGGAAVAAAGGRAPRSREPSLPGLSEHVLTRASGSFRPPPSFVQSPRATSAYDEIEIRPAGAMHIQHTDSVATDVHSARSGGGAGAGGGEGAGGGGGGGSRPASNAGVGELRRRSSRALVPSSHGSRPDGANAEDW